MTATESNKGETYSTAGAFATLDCFDTDSDATFEVAAFNYGEGHSDLEATISFGGMEVSLGMSPEQARELRANLGAALDEVEHE